MSEVEIHDNPRAMQEIENEVLEALSDAVDAIIPVAQLEAPVITGKLRDSIKNGGVDETKMEVYIESEVEYCGYVHLGHVTKSGSFVPPNPFIDRAIILTIPEAKQIG